MKNCHWLVLVSLFFFIASSTFSQVYNYPDSWGKQGLTVLDQDNQNIHLNYSINTLFFDEIDVKGGKMISLKLPDVFLPNDEGAPDLPGLSRYIAIPKGANISAVVKSYRSVKFNDVDIAPAPRIPLDNEQGPLQYEKNPKYYTKNAAYPENIIEVASSNTIRGLTMALLGITPFQYNPVSRELIVYRDIEIEIQISGGSGKVGEDRLRNKWWDAIIKDAVINPDILQPVSKINPSGKDAPDFEYLIITPDDPDFLAWADSIKTWRTLQGIKTGIVTTSEVGGNTTTAIESYVNNAYNTWDIPPVAVLLLGDYGTSGNTVVSPIYNSYCVFDNIYADVNNDQLPDIIFARMTAQNAAHLETMVSKFLNYERTPPTNPDFYQNPITACGWQTERWFQLCSEIVGGFWKETQGKTPVRINEVYSGTPGSSWSSTTYGNTSAVVSYFGPDGLGYIPSSPDVLGGWTGGNATQINNAMNSGAFMLQHRDHGGESGWGEPDYTSSDINGLTNTDLTWIFSINCLTGKYNYASEVFTEKFHRYTYNGQNAGALGVTAASEVSYSFVNDVFVWGMYDNMWPEFMPTYGTSPDSRDVMPSFGMAAGKIHLSQSSWPYNTSNKEVTYHLFHHHGDAFTTVYSEMPQNLNVVHNDFLLSGTTTFQVNADAGSMIALTSAGEILATTEATGSTQNLTIPSLAVGAELVITVTKQNYYRYSSVASVIPPSGAYVIYQSGEILDPTGNNNGLADYGEAVQYSVTLENIGSQTATNVSAMLTSVDPFVSIFDNSQFFSDIPTGATATETSAFSFIVSDAIEDQHQLEFELEVTGLSEETWTSNFTIVVNAPRLEAATELTIDDFSGGNGNGMLDPGETVTIIANVSNIGQSTSPEALANLTTGSSYISIISGIQSLGEIEAGNSTEASFTVFCSPSTPVGEAVDFQVDVFADNYSIAKNYFETIGLVIEDWETGDFTGFPWIQGGTADWTITSEEMYEGAFAAKSGTISHNQTSEMSLTVEVVSDDYISFYRKVSSEPSYDYLRFYIDDVLQEQWSGEYDWTEESYPVLAGVKTFKWVYFKDGSVSSGSDCAWIDYIILPPIATIEPEISVNPATIEFGNVLTGTVASEMITITNSGSGVLNGSMITPAGFSITVQSENVLYKSVQDNTISFEIAPAGSEDFLVSFSPTDPLCYSGMININSNDPSNGVVYVDLNGCGANGSEISTNPAACNIILAKGAGTESMLNIYNDGDMTLEFTAQVVYQSDTKSSATVHPLTSSYQTGSCSSSSKTETSLVKGYPPSEAGWMIFDVSSIPDGSIINSVEFNGFVNAQNWPYWNITPLSVDPLSASAFELYNDIIAESSAGYYLYRSESSSYTTGWKSHTLGGTVNTDLASALSQGWFPVGIMDRDASSYYIYFDGWNETNPPYMVIDYTYEPTYNWIKADGGTNISGAVDPGGKQEVLLSFDANSLEPGTYNAEIQITHNDISNGQIIIPCVLEVSNGFSVSLKVYLEGAFDVNGMHTNLNDQNYIPYSQPYNMDPWNYAGIESITEMPNDRIVDWVLIELRETTGDVLSATSSTNIGFAAGFVLNNGYIVMEDGISPLHFESTLSNNIYAVVYHRNHLSVMSSNSLFQSGNEFYYDFTLSETAVYGNHVSHVQLASEAWGMRSGNGRNDAEIDNQDKNELVVPYFGILGYLPGDFNLDGIIDSSDLVIWNNNAGKCTMLIK